MAGPPPPPPGFVIAQPGSAPPPPQQRRVIEGPPREAPPQTPAQARRDTAAAAIAETDLANAPNAQRETELRIQKLEQDVANADPVAKQRQGAAAVLRAAGIDLARGVDPVMGLIEGSTSGRAQALGADIYGGVTGDATAGMENIGRLKTIASTLTLQLMNGSLGTGISNADREFIVDQIGNLGDPNVPADQRLAAWDQVKRRMANLTGAAYPGQWNSAAAEQRDDVPPPGPAGGSANLQMGFDQPDAPPPSMSPPQAAAYDAFLKANPNVTPGQLRAFGMSMGLNFTNAEDVVSALRKGGSFAPGSMATVTAPDISDARSPESGGFLENLDAEARGAADIFTLGHADEIAAAGDTLFGGGGTYDENLRRQRAIDAYDAEHNFLPRLAGQGAAGLALPGAGTRGVVGNAALGAGYGGAYGFGSGEGGFVNRAENALVGAGLGAVTGAGAGAVGNWLSREGNAERAELMSAAQRQQVPILPADVGGPVVRRVSSGAAQLPFAGAPIIRGVQAANEAAGAARDRAASTLGRALDPEDAGNAAARGGKNFINRTSARASQLYQRAERAAGDTRIAPTRAVEALDRNIAELAETPGGTEGLSALQSLREQLNGEFTVAGIRRMRTTLRDKFIQDGLRGSDLERRVGQVVDAAADDVVAGLKAQGRNEAANAYRTADRYWRNRIRTIDNVLDPVIGNGRSGEQIVRSLQSSAKGNTEQLSQFIASLPEEEAGIVRATLISQLGRPTSGTDAGTGFSLNQFLTHWNAMTPRARKVVFQGESYDALDDLAKIARATRQAQSFANRSNTGGALNVSESGRLLSTAGAFTTFGATTLAEMATGRLLASPAFARWLAGTTRTKNPLLHIKGLGTIAARNPEIAQEALGLQRMLMDAANDNLANAGSAAASPEQGPDNAHQ